MTVVKSSLSKDQEKKLLSLFGRVRLHLLYKANVHGYAAVSFHQRCDNQGPTLLVAYNDSGYVFGAYTAKDYGESEDQVSDGEAFLYSLGNGKENAPLRVASDDGQYGFNDGEEGPDFGALKFLEEDAAVVVSNPGAGYTFDPVDMHGDDLALTEFEVYRVEGERFLVLLLPSVNTAQSVPRPPLAVEPPPAAPLQAEPTRTLR